MKSLNDSEKEAIVRLTVDASNRRHYREKQIALVGVRNAGSSKAEALNARV
jgi:hypothetical protein